MWADKTGDKNRPFDFIRPGFASLLEGARVLVVEDIINRRHTVLKVMSRIRELGGEVIGVSAVVTLPDVSAENLGTLQFERMGEISYQAWPPDQCVREGPCSRSEPVVVDPGLGHGAEFAAEHPDYAGGFVTLLV